MSARDALWWERLVRKWGEHASLALGDGYSWLVRIRRICMTVWWLHYCNAILTLEHEGQTDRWNTITHAHAYTYKHNGRINNTTYNPAVLNLLRLEDLLQILSLGREPPLKVVPLKIAKIGLFVCLYPKKFPLLTDHQAEVCGQRTTQVENCCYNSLNQDENCSVLFTQW